MKPLAVVMIMGLVAAGCGDKKSETNDSSKSATAHSDKDKKSTASAEASTTAAAAAAPTTSASAAVATGDLPTQEDFEDKAQTGITPTNANDEIAKLDKEIGK